MQTQTCEVLLGLAQVSHSFRGSKQSWMYFPQKRCCQYSNQRDGVVRHPQDRSTENAWFIALLMSQKEHWEHESLQAGLLCEAHELLWVCSEEKVS